MLLQLRALVRPQHGEEPVASLLLEEGAMGGGKELSPPAEAPLLPRPFC